MKKCGTKYNLGPALTAKKTSKYRSAHSNRNMLRFTQTSASPLPVAPQTYLPGQRDKVNVNLPGDSHALMPKYFGDDMDSRNQSKTAAEAMEQALSQQRL